MERTDTDIETLPASPTLHEPTEAEVLDGQNVTFAWEPVASASTYTLQVAATASFDDMVLEETFDNATAATVTGFFPTDHQTFFWRVLASNDDGTSRGERVESFIAATADDAQAHSGLPEQHEDMGPVTELVRSAKQDVASRAQVFEESRFEREKEQGVAYEGLAAGQIAAIAFSTMLVVAIAATIVFFWSGKVTSEAQQSAVNSDNYTILREARLDAAEKLEQYRVIDEDEGIYQIPIDRAMDIIANEEYTSRSEAEQRDQP